MMHDSTSYFEVYKIKDKLNLEEMLKVFTSIFIIDA